MSGAKKPGTSTAGAGRVDPLVMCKSTPNPDAIIVTTHSARCNVVEKKWSELGFEYIIPYGGKKLLARVFAELVSTGESSFGDQKINDVVFLHLKRGQSLVTDRT